MNNAICYNNEKCKTRVSKIEILEKTVANLEDESKKQRQLIKILLDALEPFAHVGKVAVKKRKSIEPFHIITAKPRDHIKAYVAKTIAKKFGVHHNEH